MDVEKWLGAVRAAGAAANRTVPSGSIPLPSMQLPLVISAKYFMLAKQ